MLRDCEYENLKRNNYVFPYDDCVSSQDSYVCITDKLWGELMKNEDNQKIINSLK